MARSIGGAIGSTPERGQAGSVGKPEKEEKPWSVPDVLMQELLNHYPGLQPALLAVFGMIGEMGVPSNQKDMMAEAIGGTLPDVARLDPSLRAYYWQGREDPFIAFEALRSGFDDAVIAPLARPSSESLVAKSDQVVFAASSGDSIGNGAFEEMLGVGGDYVESYLLAVTDEEEWAQIRNNLRNTWGWGVSDLLDSAQVNDPLDFLARVEHISGEVERRVRQGVWDPNAPEHMVIVVDLDDVKLAPVYPGIVNGLSNIAGYYGREAGVQIVVRVTGEQLTQGILEVDERVQTEFVLYQNMQWLVGGLESKQAKEAAMWLWGSADFAANLIACTPEQFGKAGDGILPGQMMRISGEECTPFWIL